jgi:hypothetical protein
MKISLIISVIILLSIVGYFLYKNNEDKKEKFVELNKKNINEKEIMNVIMANLENVLKTQDLKPKFKDYTRSLVKDFYTKQINNFKKSKDNKVNLSSRAKTILDMNDKLLKSNKNIKILVINNKRYIFDKNSNRKIKEETLELFDWDFGFSKDNYYSAGDTPNSCTGAEGPNPLCPCSDNSKSCGVNKMGYCCYGVSASNDFGNCRDEPCPDDWEIFLEYYLPLILYTVGTFLVSSAVAVLLGVAVAGITVVAAPWILAAGLALIIGTAIYDYIKGGLTRSGINLGFSVKNIYSNIPETENLENSLTIGDNFTDNNVDNVVVISNENPNNSGIIGNKGYIAVGRIPENILDNIIQVYFPNIDIKDISVNCSTNVCNGKLDYSKTYQNNIDNLLCCIKSVKCKDFPCEQIINGKKIFSNHTCCINKESSLNPSLFSCKEWIDRGICTNPTDLYTKDYILNTRGGGDLVDKARRNCCSENNKICETICDGKYKTTYCTENGIKTQEGQPLFDPKNCCGPGQCENGRVIQYCGNNMIPYYISNC